MNFGPMEAVGLVGCCVPPLKPLLAFSLAGDARHGSPNAGVASWPPRHFSRAFRRAHRRDIIDLAGVADGATSARARHPVTDFGLAS
jgi:hypothetical protein